MPLQSGDIRFARSAVMADVDSGGGPPTAQLVPDGASNAIFPDISEDARTGGLVEIRQLHGVLRNTDTDALLGANIIVAEPPDDANVSITLIKSSGTFARRPDLVKLIEATSTPGSEFNGYLLENHVIGQRSLQIAQRPGAEPPSVNTSLVLVLNEGLSTQVLQYVRVRRVTVTVQTFTEIDAQGRAVDFDMQLAACELFSPLAFDFAGSPPSRTYARQSTKTKTRSVTMSDAGTFYSAAPLTAPALATDTTLQLSTIFTQLVPNTRTETPLLNQRPAGTRSLTLTDALGTLQVSDAVHTERIFITEANQGNAFVFKLNPPPAPGSVTISYLAQATWSTVVDDGAGALGSGPGAGTVLYSTGDVALTTEALPDYNSFIIATWASTAPYINAVAGGQVVLTEAPTFVLDTQVGASVNGAVIGWTSGGVAKSATANAAGVLSGDATGQLVSALGKLLLTTTAMPDTGANFTVTYQQRPVTTVTSAPFTAGQSSVTLALPSEPLPGTVSARWTAVNYVSATSAANLSGTSSADDLSATHRRTTLESSPLQEVVLHEVTDDGAGNLADAGTVDYAGRSATISLTGATSVLAYSSSGSSLSSFLSSSLSN